MSKLLTVGKEATARQLLRADRAKYIRRILFTIKMLFTNKEYFQEEIAKKDTNSKITWQNGTSIYIVPEII